MWVQFPPIINTGRSEGQPDDSSSYRLLLNSASMAGTFPFHFTEDYGDGDNPTLSMRSMQRRQRTIAIGWDTMGIQIRC